MENGHPISFSIFHRKWKMENGYLFLKKWATEKATKTTVHILVLWHNYCWNRYLLLLSTPNKFSSVFWQEEWLVGATPSTLNIRSTGPHWSYIADFEPVFARSASAVTPSEKSF